MVCFLLPLPLSITSTSRPPQIELKATKIELLGACPPATYPLAGKGHSLRFLRTVAHLRPRTKAIASVARIRNALSFAVHAFFQAQNFMYIHTPLITTSDCEGGGEMFQVTTLLPEPEKLPAEEEKKSGPLTGGGGGFKKQDVSLDYAKDFFKRPAFLTVSGQLNVETYCQALSNVYTFGPTFRAEVSHTTRHLAEFWMIEPELAFADLRDVMENAEAFLKFCISEALKRCPEDLAYLEEFEKKQEAERLKEERAEAKRIQAERAAFFKEQKRRQAAGEELLPDPSSEQQQQQQQAKKKKKKRKKPKQAAKSFKSIPLRERLAQVIGQPFARITYTEAIQRLQQAVEENEVEFEEDEITWGMDLASEHEKYLCEQVFKRPLIVRDYPKGIKAFYMRMNPDGDTVAAMDILVPGLGEIIGGSQREERLELLQDRMQDMGIQAEDYEWYLDLRRYGSVPHSGFGLGFERLVCYVTGMDNIRDVIPFPRTVGHAEF